MEQPPPPSPVPAGWYHDPSGPPGQQRYWDGTAWTVHVHSAARPYEQGSPPTGGAGPRAGRKPWYARPLPLVAAGFALLLVIGAIAGAGDTGSGGARRDASRGGGGSGAGGVPIAGVGDPLTLKGTTYRVLSSKTASSVGQSFTRAKADGVFVVVKIELNNRKDDTRTISSDAIKLVSGGKTYDTDSDALLTVDDQILLEEIQPGLPKKGTLIYDIPDRAVRGARLRVEDLFSSDYGLVRLRL